VAPDGRFYAIEIEHDELAQIPRRAADAGLANLTVVKASHTDTGLAGRLLRRHLYDRRLSSSRGSDATDRSIFAALRRGGRLFIADFYPTWLFSFWTTPTMRRNFGGHGVAEPLLVSRLKSVGFKLVEEISGYPSKGRPPVTRL
jgi:hypothetical protein